jgi:hypothetical protein
MPATVLGPKAIILKTGSAFTDYPHWEDCLNQIVDHMFNYISDKCYGKQAHRASREHDK